MLRLSGVTKRFGGRTVLNKVSLEVAPGEHVAVLGESGIGKSTLLNVIAGLEPVDSGSIAYDGFEMAALSDDAATRVRRDHFGFVFQAFHLLPHLDAEQNVGLPLLLRGTTPEEIRSRARALLGAVGLGDRAAAMPRELSGGELQRVAIARALVGHPARPGQEARRGRHPRHALGSRCRHLRPPVPPHRRRPETRLKNGVRAEFFPPGKIRP